MAIKNYIEGINKHFNDHLLYYLVSILFMATGVILGLYCVKYMGMGDKDTLIKYITSINTSGQLDGVMPANIFIGALKNNMPLIIGYWVLGLTMVGMPIILILNIYKGFSLGFTCSFFIYGLKGKGVALALLGVVPQNIIYVPCFIFLSVISLEYSMGMIKEKLNIGKKYQEPMSLKSYSVTVVIILVIMMAGFFLETFLSPWILRAVLK